VTGKTLPAPLALVIQGKRGPVGICVGLLMLPQVAHRGKLFVTHAQLSYLLKAMAGKTLPSPLALVIERWRGRVWIGMGSLMLLQITHRGKEFQHRAQLSYL
jgi:hypothetical protein